MCSEILEGLVKQLNHVRMYVNVCMYILWYIYVYMHVRELVCVHGMYVSMYTWICLALL